MGYAGPARNRTRGLTADEVKQRRRTRHGCGASWRTAGDPQPKIRPLDFDVAAVWRFAKTSGTEREQKFRTPRTVAADFTDYDPNAPAFDGEAA